VPPELSGLFFCCGDPVISSQNAVSIYYSSRIIMAKKSERSSAASSKALRA